MESFYAISRHPRTINITDTELIPLSSPRTEPSNYSQALVLVALSPRPTGRGIPSDEGVS